MKPRLPKPDRLRRHLLFRLILPVSAIAVLSLVLSMGLAWNAYRRWAREFVMQDDHSRLAQASATLSAFHDWFVPYLHSVRGNPDILPLMSGDPPELFDLVKGLDQLDDARANGRSIHSLYLYNRPAGFYLSTKEGLEALDDVDPEIARLVNESVIHKPYRYHLRTIGSGNGTVDVLTMMVGDLPSQGNRPLQRGLIANIDLTAFSQDFLTGMGSRGAFRIADSEGRILMRLGNGPEFLMPDGVFTPQGSLLVRSEGETIAVSWHHNTDLDWWLIIGSDLSGSAFAADSRDAGVLAAILLVLTAALVVTYRAAWGLYRPFRMLVPHLTPLPAGPSPRSVGSVYSEIDQSVRSLGNQLDRDKMRDFLEGALSPRESAAMVGQVSGRLSVPAPWIVAAMSVEASGPFREDAVEYMILDGKKGGYSGVLESSAAQGRSIGLGREAATVTELPRSAREAREALAYRFREGTGRLILFDDIAGDPEEPYDLPIRSVRRLLEKLNTGNARAAGDTLSDVLEDLNEHRPEDFRMTLTLLAYELRRDLLPLTEIDPAFGAVLDARLEDAVGAETLDDASTAFRELFAAATGRQDPRHDDRSLVIADQARNIMERDLGNPSLCPDSIAGEIGLSTSYLRDIFKRVTGQSLSRAIQDLRIAECRKLLEETDRSVKDVAAEIGYRNYNSFFSTFRRVVGLTPLEYRESRSSSAET